MLKFITKRMHKFFFGEMDETTKLIAELLEKEEGWVTEAGAWYEKLTHKGTGLHFTSGSTPSGWYSDGTVEMDQMRHLKPFLDNKSKYFINKRDQEQVGYMAHKRSELQQKLGEYPDEK